jgi:hypothetical protein
VTTKKQNTTCFDDGGLDGRMEDSHFPSQQLVPPPPPPTSIHRMHPFTYCADFIDFNDFILARLHLHQIKQFFMILYD